MMENGNGGWELFWGNKTTPWTAGFRVFYIRTSKITQSGQSSKETTKQQSTKEQELQSKGKGVMAVESVRSEECQMSRAMGKCRKVPEATKECRVR